MIAANKASIPGNNELDAVSLLGRLAAGQGRHDLFLAADRPHVRQLLAERQGDQLRPAVRRSPARSATRSCRAIPEHATGYNKALAADSANPEAAYLFMQWATLAAGVAGARACCPTRCAIPTGCRTSSRTSTGALWPDAKDYLINLNNSANVGLLDMIMPGWQDYALSLDRMCTSVWAGTDPKAALQTAAAEWDATTRAPRRRFARRRSTRSTRSCRAPPPTTRSRRWAWP